MVYVIAQGFLQGHYGFCRDGKWFLQEQTWFLQGQKWFLHMHQIKLKCNYLQINCTYSTNLSSLKFLASFQQQGQTDADISHISNEDIPDITHMSETPADILEKKCHSHF